MAKKDKLIILDRDGVINEESANYIKCPAEWKPIPGSLRAIALLNQHGYTVVVVTNQSGVARGYYTEAELAKIHQKMCACVKEQGGSIDRIFYCAHHPQERCACRKPATGLLQQIADAYEVDLSGMILIGDSLCDIHVAQKLACRPILVLTGNGTDTLKNNPQLRDKISIFSDLKTAVNHLLKGQPHVKA